MCFYDPLFKVRDIKLRIFQELEFKQKMNLLWQNKEMEDSMTLRAIGITEDTAIEMVHQPDTKIKLTVQSFKKGKIVVELKDSDTLTDLDEALSTSTSKTPAKVTH